MKSLKDILSYDKNIDKIIKTINSIKASDTNAKKQLAVTKKMLTNVSKNLNNPSGKALDIGSVEKALTNKRDEIDLFNHRNK